MGAVVRCILLELFDAQDARQVESCASGGRKHSQTGCARSSQGRPAAEAADEPGRSATTTAGSALFQFVEDILQHGELLVERVFGGGRAASGGDPAIGPGALSNSLCGADRHLTERLFDLVAGAGE
ncbi:hypothetical protein ACFQL1_01585 [Halomicroarcula sp. GCM10025709]|uniref:hypothetical protein n=1 Tax=Halomicroarcula sp. GCM10025709 TaxID=3252669 RepID=UPI00361BFA36